MQLLVVFASCNGDDGSDKKVSQQDSISESRKHLPENALHGLAVAKGLTVQPIATEPLLRNPTNIDVDERGRIWVVEAYNYRPRNNGNPVNPQGDRIVIIEDIGKEGNAPRSKVFYQGPEINAPMGICVLGNRVLVSQSPYVWSFYDDNGDDSADRKEILFQGIGGVQHDHGMHSFNFGPDGKLYFNFGNEGKTLKDRHGKVVVDQDGDEIGPAKYKQGMVFRCNPDGSEVECLGQNFRNNYEVAVDSYGTMWQSDNDDDGNNGVRINYVMEYGNYGFHDEMTDAGWESTRTNLEDSIYERHWHLNDPGVIPNLLQTGAGSPTGMIVYEGSLLPGEFYGQMIHCDPGQNVVRSYPVTKNGAGYKAAIQNIARNEEDQWFRPVDVCAAPDGSLLVADWYDPIVGGHGAGDQERGRIYRIAPNGSQYTVPVFDFATPAGAVEALQNANLAARYRAWTAIQQMGGKAIPALEELWRSGKPSRMRARALWALSRMPSGMSYVREAIQDSDPELRITALRAVRQLHNDQLVLEAAALLVRDRDPQVRRECALALRHKTSPEAAALWAELALQHNGNDRWYLEALGIGADRQWDKFVAAYLQSMKDPLQSPAARDIVWRSRGESVLPMLSVLAADPGTSMKSRLRYFRAFDFHTGPTKSKVLLKMLDNDTSRDTQRDLLILHHLDPNVMAQSPLAGKVLGRVLDDTYGTKAYLELVRQYGLRREKQRLVSLAEEKFDQPEGAEAIRLLVEFGNKDVLRNMVVTSSDTGRAVKFLRVLGAAGYTETIDIVQEVVLSDRYNASLRLKAAEMLGKSFGGEDRVIELLRDKQVPRELIPAVVAGVKGGLRSGIYKTAVTYLPGGKNEAKGGKAPSVASLLPVKGNVKRGTATFETACAVCHQVKGAGTDFGPKLGKIGAKLPREALFKAIINPSSGISFGFEKSQISLKNGTSLIGIISSRTEKELELKYPGGTRQTVKMNDIKNIKELPESMMPAMYESLSNQEIADVVEYLSTLR